MAELDPGSTRESNDAGECIEVSGDMLLVFFFSLFVLSTNGVFSFTNSGNVVIETKFFDDDLLVSTSRVRLFYV